MNNEFSCYQWIIQDNQQLHYNEFFVGKKHYVNRKDVDADYAPENTEYCFHPIRLIRESKITGRLAEAVYEHERESDIGLEEG